MSNVPGGWRGAKKNLAPQMGELRDVAADQIGTFLRHENGDGQAGRAMDEVDQPGAGGSDDGFGAREQGDLFAQR